MLNCLVKVIAENTFGELTFHIHWHEGIGGSPRKTTLISLQGQVKLNTTSKGFLIIWIFPCSFSKQAEWQGGFHSALLLTLVSFMQWHSCLAALFPCRVGSWILGPVFQATQIQGCCALLTCRLPGECIICESCPFGLESVSCWLPASTRRRTLGKHI